MPWPFQKQKIQRKWCSRSFKSAALLSVYLAQDVSPNSLNGSSCSTDTPSTQASASLNLVVSQQLPAKLLLLMILFLLRLLIIVVVVGIFLVLLSRKNFQELFQAPASRLLSSLSSHLYNYYAAKKWKDCPLSSGKWSAGLGTARRWRVMLLSLQSIT